MGQATVGGSQLLALAPVTSPRSQRPQDLSNPSQPVSSYFYSTALQNKHKPLLGLAVSGARKPPLIFLLFLKNFTRVNNRVWEQQGTRLALCAVDGAGCPAQGGRIGGFAQGRIWDLFMFFSSVRL